MPTHPPPQPPSSDPDPDPSPPSDASPDPSEDGPEPSPSQPQVGRKTTSHNRRQSTARLTKEEIARRHKECEARRRDRLYEKQAAICEMVPGLDASNQKQIVKISDVATPWVMEQLEKRRELLGRLRERGVDVEGELGVQNTFNPVLAPPTGYEAKRSKKDKGKGKAVEKE